MDEEFSLSIAKGKKKPRLAGVSTFILIMAVLYLIACFPLLGLIIPSPGLLLSSATTSMLRIVAPPGAAGMAFVWFWVSAFNFPISVFLIVEHFSIRHGKLVLTTKITCLMLGILHVISGLIYWPIIITGGLHIPIGIAYLLSSFYVNRKTPQAKLH